MIYFKKAKGFTLIELLVAISIISVLASVVLSSLKQARNRAITVRAVMEVDQIAKALQFYYDEYGNFPLTDDYGENSTWCDWDQSEWDHDGDGVHFVDFLVQNDFLSSDIKSAGGSSFYLYTGDASENLGLGDCGCAAPGTAAIVALNLPTSISGVTDNDDCDGSLWNLNGSCPGEISPTVYCKLISP